MRKIILYIFLLLPCICLAQQPNKRGVQITASLQGSEGITYAVVIGISKYKEVTQLRFADRDAKVFSDFLINRNGMGLDSNNVKLFLNEKATLNNIGNALSDIITKNLKKGDKIIFFFAGHGDYDANILKDQALLLLYGAPKQNYFQNIFSGDFISTADLNSRFIDPLSSKGCEVTLIIDACHATGMNKNLSGGAEGGKITMMALENMTSPVKIYSCKANQYSLESEQWGGGRGLFSYVLMEGLYGMADLDNNKKISLRELRRYLEDNVAGMAAPNKQDPIIKIENDDVTLVNVHDSLLALYKAEKNKSLMFMAKADTKGSDDLFLMDSLQKKIYRQCDSLIEAKELDAAYQKFLIFIKQDSTSDASLQLKRNLSASLQEKSALILTPMLQDVSKFNSSRRYVEQAKIDLEKAASLLGQTHFLYKNLQARILFLNALYINLNDENDKAKDALNDLEQSVMLEPNAPYTYYYLGYFYNIDKNLEKARINYEKYLNLIPNSGWAYDNLGIVYNDLKNYDKAIYNYKKGIEMDSADAMAYCNLGMLYEYLNKNEEAKKVYTKAIEQIPANTTAYLSVGLIYKGLKKYEESIKYFKKEIETYPYSSLGYTDIGISYRLTKKYNDAIKSYLKAIELDSTDAYTYNNMGNVYTDLKKYKEALEYYKKAINIKPDYPVGLNNLGLAYNNLKYYDSAIIFYQKAVKADSLYADPYYNLGLAYHDMENYDSAIINYLIAIKFNPKDGSAYYNLGIIYNHQNKYSEAISSYKKAIEFDSADRAGAYNNLGLIYSSQENYDEAGINYKKSIAIDSAYARAWYNLGDILYKFKKYDESTMAYKKAVQLDSSFTSAIYSIGLNYFNLEKYDEALIYYQKYNYLRPGTAVVLKNIGDIYYDQFKNYDSSAYYFSKSYELKNDDKNIIERLAYSFLRIGKTTEAVETFKKEISLFPDDPWGYYNIACVFSLGNQTADALEYFKMALDKNMNELSHWETDSDINNIRTLPAFKILLEKKFSKKELTNRPNMFIIIKK